MERTCATRPRCPSGVNQNVADLDFTSFYCVALGHVGGALVVSIAKSQNALLIELNATFVDVFWRNPSILDMSTRFQGGSIPTPWG